MASNSKDKDFAPINVDMNDRIPMSSQRRGSGEATKTIVKSNNGFTTFVLLLAVIACAGAGYLYFLHLENQKAMVASEQRILSLEKRLSATGEEIDNSTVALQVKVGELSSKADELWDQMDKLWASAWRRNQQDIKDLSSDLTRFQKSVTEQRKGIEQDVNNSTANIQKVQNRIDSLNSKLNAQANEMLASTVSQEGLQENINAQKSELRELTEKIILLERRNTKLLQQIQQMDSKLTELANKSV